MNFEKPAGIDRAGSTRRTGTFPVHPVISCFTGDFDDSRSAFEFQQDFTAPADGRGALHRPVDLIKRISPTDIGAEDSLADEGGDFAKQEQSRGDGAFSHPVAKPEPLDNP